MTFKFSRMQLCDERSNCAENMELNDGVDRVFESFLVCWLELKFARSGMVIYSNVSLCTGGSGWYRGSED